MAELPKPSGNDDENNFHMWVGYCIAGWSEVEDRLFELCWKSLNCEAELAAIVYFRTPTVDARLSLVSELVTAVLPSREKKNGGHDHASVTTWNDIAKSVRDLLTVRRRLAHQPVHDIFYAYEVPLRAGDPIGPSNRLETAVLHYTHRSDAENLRPKTGDTAPLYRKDLMKHHSQLKEVTERLGRFFLDQFLPLLVERQKQSPQDQHDQTAGSDKGNGPTQ